MDLVWASREELAEMAGRVTWRVVETTRAADASFGISRVVVRLDALDVQVIPHEVIIPPDEAPEGAKPAPKVPGKVRLALSETHPGHPEKRGSHQNFH